MRLQNGLYLLDQRPNDPELLHAVGVGLAHRGIAALEYEASRGCETAVDLYFFLNAGLFPPVPGGRCVVFPAPFAPTLSRNLRP